MDAFTLADPIWLLAIAALPIVAWLRGRRSVVAIAIPFAGAWKRSAIAPSSNFPALLAYLGSILLIIALARPQYVETERQTKNKGYDIMLAIDLSTSMLAEDYNDSRGRINRMKAVKPVLKAFIEKRTNDRIGLVAFAGKAYTVAPLTFDHAWLARQTDRLAPGLIEDGTAIGDAAGAALARLNEGAKERAGERKGAYIILLTDGENNSGVIEPLDAAQLAAESGIRLFTIAAGREGWVIMPELNDQGQVTGYGRAYSRVDTSLLKAMASTSEGSYFRAEEKDTIEEAFAVIDKASKVEFEVNQYSTATELYPYLAMAAAAFLLIAASLTNHASKEAWA